MKYIVSIDGGGTKTLGVLFEKSGKELKRITNGFSNFSVDKIVSSNNIFKTIEELIKDLDIKDVLAIEIGVAGYTNFDSKDMLLTELKQKFPTNISMGTDALMAYYSVKRDNKLDVVMVLGGTGSVVTYEQDNDIKFVGGFGHILGDQGSGYHLAVKALKNVIKQHEEGKTITKLSKDILENLGTSDYNFIKNFVYNNKKSDIAALTEFISKKAFEDDKEAIKLFIDEGVYLAEQTSNAVNLLNSKEEVLIGIKGSFLMKAPYVKETFIQELNKRKINYIIDEMVIEPVYGGYYLAVKHLSSGEVYL